MIGVSRIVMVGCGVLLVGFGCRTRERVPDYLPREVVANQVGSAVVYQVNDPRIREVRAATPPSDSAPVMVSAPSTQVTTPVASVSPSVAVTEAPRINGSTPRQTLYGQPDGVVVSDRGLREVTITWKAPTDEVYRYRIERAESPEGPFVKLEDVAPKKLSYKDTGSRDTPLNDNTAYYYRLIALLDREGPESIPSAVVKSVTAPPPEAPAAVKAVASSSRAVTVTWAASPSEGVTLYRVERAKASAPSAFERVGVPRVTTLTDGGTAASVLMDSTRYLYRVIAVNRVNSESSPSTAPEVLTLPPPAPVRNVAVLCDEVRCVPLSWAPNPEADVVRYDVYRARLPEGPFEKIGSVSGRTTVAYLDGGTNPGNLEDEAIYYYKLRAVNAVTSEGAPSDVVKAFTRGVPVEVSALNAVTGRPREIPVSWLMSLDKSVVGYELWRADEGGDNWVQVKRFEGRDSTNYLDRGEIKPTTGLGFLKDGTVYQYKVIGFNNANVKSSASAAATARTKYRPATPACLSATTNAPLSINLAWNPNPEKDISDYVVECSDRPDESFHKLVTVSAGRAGGLSAREMSLESGVTRFSRIKAIDKDGLESDWCAAVAGRAKPVPDAPGLIKGEPVGNNVRLVWKAPAQTDVQRYNVWRKKFIGWELIATTEQTNYLFEFTEVSKPMTVAATAVDKDGLESEKSETVEIKPGM
ncbi:MAG: hypothetical protein WCO42_08705 [bacterium]